MEKNVSTYKSALAYEDVSEPIAQVVDLLPMRHISFNTSPAVQPASHVVKVSGNITVSF